jgi:hypothetical protein
VDVLRVNRGAGLDQRLGHLKTPPQERHAQGVLTVLIAGRDTRSPLQ